MTCSFGSVVNLGPSRFSEDLSPLRASKTCASAILLTRLPDLYDRVLAAWDAATHPDLAVLCVDRDDLEVPDRRGLVAHLSRHLLSLEDAGRVGGGADGAGLADVVRAVAHRATREPVTLDGPLEALALRRRADVDPVAHLEHVRRDGAADLARDAAKLLEVLARRSVELGEGARVGLLQSARPGRPEADLHGLVAVLLRGADRRYE